MFVVCPDEPTKKVVLEYAKKYPQIYHIHQPRKLGKNVMLNKVINMAKGKILIFTDGDIFVNQNSVSEILKKFDDPKIGCVTGRPISSNSRNTMLGYWAHLLTDGAHMIRLKREQLNEFIECSGYLFAIRNGVINEIPLDVAEDSIIPAMFWEKGYKIGYANKATALVQFPIKLKEWINQKTRCAKAHEKLDDYTHVKKMKSFRNELMHGTLFALKYPKTLKELIWTLILFPTRIYVWTKYFYDIKIANIHYGDRWSRLKTTRPLD